MKRLIVLFSLVAGLVGLLTLCPWLGAPADAYSTWTTNGTDNCASCHGDFRDVGQNGYLSLVDNSAWLINGAPTSLHDGHRTVMLSSDCNTCHSAGSFSPVFLFQSAGGKGFAPISCLGCHGRKENGPGGPGNVTGTGLRQAHYRAGQIGCADCHDDSNPAGAASFTPVGENVKPPYYFTPDAAHPKKPTNPCNKGGTTESKIASSLGLDNDGNGLFDLDDLACAGPVTLTFPNGGPPPLDSGSPQTILWTAAPKAVNFKLALSVDNGATWTPITPGFVTGNNFPWTVPTPPANKKKCLVRITAYDASKIKLGADTSATPFAIEVVRLTSPNGGEAPFSGAQFNVTWSIFDTIQPVTKVKLLFTKNGGTTWTTLATLPTGAYPPGDYNQNVTLPSVTTAKTMCKMKVVVTNAAGVAIGSDLSDANFTLQP